MQRHIPYVNIKKQIIELIDIDCLNLEITISNRKAFKNENIQESADKGD
jgi:hypothetical protein